MVKRKRNIVSMFGGFNCCVGKMVGANGLVTDNTCTPRD